MKMQKHKIVSILLTVTILLSSLSVAAFSSFTAMAAANKSMVYFDNSFNWKNVYIYIAGNALWPGEKMTKGNDGLYYYEMEVKRNEEVIVFNNGYNEEVSFDEAEQYPPGGFLHIGAGQCKLLINSEWIDYGTPDDSPAAFVKTISPFSYERDYVDLELGLKNAKNGTYCVDGGIEVPFTSGTVIRIGQEKIAHNNIELRLSAIGEDGTKTTSTNNYMKRVKEIKGHFSSPTDGHTTEPVGGYYATNPNMQLGKYKKISIDGSFYDWDRHMLIAQGVVNDDPRVYMPSAMHELPCDDYALYAAWDDDNLYFMWEMADPTYIVSLKDGQDAFNKARPFRNSFPIFLALSIDPTKSGSGKAIETDPETGVKTEHPYVWGTEKDGGMTYSTNVDTIVAFDTNNTNGANAIIKLNDDGFFDYDTSIKIGVKSYQNQDNQNGFKIKFGNGTKSTSLMGIYGEKGSRIMGDSYDLSSNWLDYYSLGYSDRFGYFYEISIPLEHLGIDKDYIETQGIGVMKIGTYGTSGMSSLPHDPSMLDNAAVPYSKYPSTSHEKEDEDNISVPLARVGALLADTKVYDAPLQVNFGSDKCGPQSIGTEINLLTETYGGKGPYTYDFTVNGITIDKTSTKHTKWYTTEAGVYTIGVNVMDSANNTISATKKLIVSDGTSIPTEPITQPTSIVTTPSEPVSSITTDPSSIETTPSEPTSSIITDPSSINTTPIEPTSFIEPTTINTTPTEPSSITQPGKLKGDADMNGKLNIRDATCIQKWIIEYITESEIDLVAADVNEDGKVNIRDATNIQKKILEILVDW